MGEIELKACPFCAAYGETLFIEHMEGTIRHPAYCVRCDNCGASSRYTDKDCRKVWNERAPQWQPIESAPKDGTRVLLCCMTTSEFQHRRMGFMAVCGYDDGGWPEFNRHHWPATHWMPLPAPPEVEG